MDRSFGIRVNGKIGLFLTMVGVLAMLRVTGFKSQSAEPKTPWAAIC